MGKYLYNIKKEKKRICISDSGLVHFFEGRKKVNEKQLTNLKLSQINKLPDKEYDSVLNIILGIPNLNDIEVLELDNCDNTKKSLQNIDLQISSLEEGLVKKKKKYFTTHKPKIEDIKDNNVDIERLQKSINEHIDEIGITKLVVNNENVVVTDYKPDKEKVSKLLQVVDEKINDLDIEETSDIKDEGSYKSDLKSLLSASVYNVLKKFNKSIRIIIEYTPKYKNIGELDVISIPRTEIIGFDIIPGETIELGDLQLKILNYENKEAVLEVVDASHIVNKKFDKIEIGSLLKVGFKEKIELYLNEENVFESWSLILSQEGLQKEIRRNDYSKIMSILRNKNKLKGLGTIERYETKLSIMLFLYFVMKNNDYKKLDSLYEVLDYNADLYEECITKYNVECAMHKKNKLSSAKRKEEFLKKTNFVNGLINGGLLDYPRYIFRSHNYFGEDSFMKNFYEEAKKELDENDLYKLLVNMFNSYDVYTNLDSVGKTNFEKCIKFLSKMYFVNPKKGETTKYYLEEAFLIGTDVETMSLMISRLCVRVISSSIGLKLSKTDKQKYKVFEKKLKEYVENIEELYKNGKLNYPIYCELFTLD